MDLRQKHVGKSLFFIFTSCAFLTIIFQNCDDAFHNKTKTLSVSQGSQSLVSSEKDSSSTSLEQIRLASQWQNQFYFGYFFSAAFNDNYVSDLAAMNDHTNISFVMTKCCSPDGLSTVIDRLKESKKNGMKAIIHVQPYFFEYPKSTMSARLRPDYMKKWNAFKNAIKGYEDHILGFLLFDEPVTNNDWVVPPQYRLSHQQVYNNLSLVNQLLKEAYPSLPTVLVFGATEVKDDMLMPPADWVGLDCYGDTSACTDEAGRVLSIRSYYDILKSKMLGHQRLVVFPQGFQWERPGHAWNVSDQDVASHVDYYKDMIEEDRRFVGMFPYLWQDTEILESRVLGTNSLPLTKAKFKEVSSYLSLRSALMTSPPVGHVDFISSQGVVTGWAMDYDHQDKPTTVKFYMDGEAGQGTYIGEVETSLLRSDVNTKLGVSGKHGFQFSIPQHLHDGKTHLLYAYAIDSTLVQSQLNTSAFQLGSIPPPSQSPPVLVADHHIPIGYVDEITPSGLIKGWSLDMDTPAQSIHVHIYVDGDFKTGKLIGSAIADVPRPDVNAEMNVSGKHGFQFQIPQSLKDGKTHSYYIYGINSNPEGQNPLLKHAPITFTYKADHHIPIGYVDEVTPSGLIKGWSLDMDTPAQSIHVHIYVDGDFKTGKLIGSAIADVPRPDVNAEMNVSGKHGFQFQIPQSLKDGKTHSYYIYGINSNPEGQNPLLKHAPITFTYK